MRTEVVFQGGWLKQIWDYLFDGSEQEYSCYIFAGLTQKRGLKRLLGRRLCFPDKGSDYEMQSRMSCKPSLWYMDNVVYEMPRDKDLIQHNLSIVDIHCHPFVTNGDVSFSSTDWQWQRDTVDHFYNIRGYSGFICFIVFGQKSYEGVVWSWPKGRKEPVCWPLQHIICLDYPYLKWENPKQKRKSRLNSRYKAMCDRQIIAFGQEGQETMGRLTAGIVGVGGIGTIAAESLARLGVKNFVLVDHDQAEVSNLNRYSCLGYADAVLNMSKTDIMAREIINISPEAKVEPVAETVFSQKAWEALKMVDFIVLGTDTLLSRAYVNEFCLQYLIPLFSIGSVINVNIDNGQILDLSGEYISVIPGRNSCCFNCTNALDYHQVSYLLSDPEVLQEGMDRGYVNIPGFNQPAVRALNAVITEMAISEIHNYFCGFKEELVEGLRLDQKRNRVIKQHYLYPRLDENIENTFIEAEVNNQGVRLVINGVERIVDLEKQDALNEVMQRFVLSDSQKSIIEQYIQNLENNRQKKTTCPYCGEQGILGKGENEPLTDYASK